MTPRTRRALPGLGNAEDREDREEKRIYNKSKCKSSNVKSMLKDQMSK